MILTTSNIISIWSKDSSLLIVSELLSRRASMSLCLCVVLCLCVRVSVLKFQPHHCIVSGLLSWRASALNLPCVIPQTPSGLGIICYQAGACRVPGNPRGKLCNTVHCSHTEILWYYCTFNQRLLHLLYYRKVLESPLHHTVDTILEHEPNV